MYDILNVKYSIQLIKMMLKSAVLGAFSVNILTPYLISYIIYESVDKRYIAVWLGASTFIFIFRVLALRNLKKSISFKSDNVIRDLYAIFFLIFLGSSINGYMLWYSSFIVSSTQLFFIATIFLTLVAASISTLGSIFHAFLIFIVVTIIPIVITFIFHGGAMYYSFALASFIFMVLMIKSGYMQYHFLSENIRLKESFQKRVKESTQELEEKNSQLNESLQVFQDLQDSSMIMISFQDEDGNILSMNRAAITQFGYESASEIIGMHMSEFLTEDSVSIVLEALKQEVSAPYELIMKRKDATEFPALISGKYTVYRGQKARMSTMMNLSEIKEKEQLLQMHSRLAQMGEMISMIAHQWRQPLNTISTTSSAIGLKAKLQKLDEEYVIAMTENISEYAQYLSNTIDDFRNFFKPDKEKVRTSFNLMLASVLNMTKYAIKKKNIRLIEVLGAEEYFISYENELKQVILNLIKNAEDALMEKSVRDPYIKIETKREGSEIVLEISDNGGGVDKKYIHEIFNPYFSTKKKKDGTGLGLYMSKIIIEEHCHGELQVINTEEGAIFRISLKDEY